MDNIILTTIPELQGLIETAVRKVLQERNFAFEIPKIEIEYITRKETARILGISLPTLNEWSKKGIIPSYRISSRVRYKKDEILNSLNKVQSTKYGRK